MLERAARKLVDAQTRFPKAFIMAFVIGTLLLAPGILNLVPNVEPSLEKVLPQDTREVALMNEMRSDLGADMMYLLVRTEPPSSDVREERFVRYMDLLAQKIRTVDYVREVQSASDIVIQRYGHVPDSQQLIDQAYGDDPRTDSFINRDRSLSLMIIRADTGASAQTITKVVDDIDDVVKSLEMHNPGSSTSLTGFNAIDKATFEVIISDFMRITVLAFALVALIVFITFKSIKKGLMPLLVVLISILWTMGIVGYLGLTITVVSMVAAAMILGLGINYGILVTHTYGHYRAKNPPKRSLTKTMEEMLRGLLGGSLTTMAGFLALLFGVLPAMKTLGIILAIGIAVTLVGSVLLLPVVVYLIDDETDKGGETC